MENAKKFLKGIDIRIIRTANVIWEENLRDGKGKMKLDSGVFEVNYSFASQFKEKKGTNPEELTGAAHTGCFFMALANILSQACYSPKRINTTAEIRLERDRLNSFYS